MKHLKDPSWVFVSHSSHDIDAVRVVRNYLEEQGGAPLLFHLVSLTEPEEFWPLIEREIEARNFFLYCESAAARESEWVQRERETVERLQERRVIRKESIRVDSGDIHLRKLDEFLAKTRVFPSSSRRDRDVVEPFLHELNRVGFQVFSEQQVIMGSAWEAQINRELEEAAITGWVVAFLSSFSVQRSNIMSEIRAARALGAKFVPVVIEPIQLPPEVAAINVFDASRDPATAPQELAQILLSRQT